MVAENRQFLFVFGGNDIGEGKKGQAVINGQPNAMPIPTKKLPSAQPEAFYHDGDLRKNKEKIRKAFEMVDSQAHKYKALVFPKDGLGTGLAQLPSKAPLTYQFLIEEQASWVRRWTQGKGM